jgi:nucleoside-diphosphate-sugar epimerase
MTGSNCALGHGFRLSGKPFEVKYFPIDEKHPSDPEDSYSFSKLTGEYLLNMYSRVYGIRAYALRAAGITDEGRRKAMAAGAGPATEWSEWMFPWIAAEDLARAHRLLMEKAGSIEPFGYYFCNNDDTTCIEPTMEILERLRPDLVPVTKGITGHGTLLSSQKLKDTVGWKPVKSWREYL